MFWIILTAALVSVGCWFVWSWANDSLFTYLGEAEITPGHWENCYTYDNMTWPARIVAFLCGVGAILVFILTWFFVIDIIIL